MSDSFFLFLVRTKSIKIYNMIKIYIQIVLAGLLTFSVGTQALAQCEAGELQTITAVSVPFGASFDVMAINEVIPANGAYGWSFDNSNTDGGGALGGLFILPELTTSESFDNNLGGILSSNDFPLLTGTWVVKGVAMTDSADPFTTTCSVTIDSLIVTFEDIDAALCQAGDLQTTGMIQVADQETFDLMTINEVLPPEPGGYGWSLDNTYTDGTGGIDTFILLPGTATAIQADNDLGGLLSFFGLPPLEGTWIFRGVTFTDVNDPEASTCSITADSLIVVFGEIDQTCSEGQLLTIGTEVLCGNEQITVTATDFESPTGGGFAYLFQNSVTGGTGALGQDFPLVGVTGNDLIDLDLGGALSLNNFPPFEGTWVLKTLSYTDPNNVVGSACGISEDSLILVFSPELDVELVNAENIEIMSNITGGIPPYSYDWSDGQTTASAMDLEDGVLTLLVTDDAGCITESSIVLENTSVEDIDGLLSYQLGPNPTNGITQLDFRLESKQRMTISISAIDGSTPSTVLVNEFSSGGLFSLDLSEYSSGIYLLHISTEQGQYASRVVKQ